MRNVLCYLGMLLGIAAIIAGFAHSSSVGVFSGHDCGWIFAGLVGGVVLALGSVVARFAR